MTNGKFIFDLSAYFVPYLRLASILGTTFSIRSLSEPGAGSRQVSLSYDLNSLGLVVADKSAALRKAMSRSGRFDLLNWPTNYRMDSAGCRADNKKANRKRLAFSFADQ